MATGTFETPTDLAPGLSGKIEASLYEVGGPAPTTVIRSSEDWYVDINWALYGAVVPMICGKWCIHLFMESIGPAPELKLTDYNGPAYIPLNPCGDGKYSYRLDVKKGTIKPEHCGTPYKLVVVVTYHNACDKPGPMGGFVELPIVQFIDAS